MYRLKKKESKEVPQRRGMALSKNNAQPIQRKPIGIYFKDQELDTDNRCAIWDYFNTLETFSEVNALLDAIEKQGETEFAEDIKQAWIEYIEEDDDQESEPPKDKYDDFAEDYMSGYERRQVKAQKPPKFNKNGFKKVVRDGEKRDALIDKTKKQISVVKRSGEQGGELKKPKRQAPKEVKGLTHKEIDGYTILSNGFNSTHSRAETDFELTSDGKIVSKPMKVHLSIQRHYFNNMDTGDAKDLNSLMTAEISRGDILKDMLGVTDAVARLWQAKKPVIPKRMQTTVPSGRTYEIDGLTIGEAHAYVISGPNVVPLTRNQFVALKAIKDAANGGDAHEAYGIIQRHLPKSTERAALYKLAATRFKISRSELAEIDPQSNSKPGKSGGKERGGIAPRPINNNGR